VLELAWPDDLTPYKVAFYLQAHVGGQESPITRVRKVYGLSAPRWVARLSFRGGYDGAVRLGDQAGYGSRLDALIADLDGGLNLIRFHDWRRPLPTSPVAVSGALVSRGAAKGSCSMQVAGFAPNSRAVSVGDYVGGDGRPHLVTLATTRAAGGRVTGAGSVMADPAGVATIGFRPPLSAAIPAGAPLTWPVTGLFQLTDPDDAGQNEVIVGDAVEQTLSFAEFLS
jgi:hypothetical protein